MTGGDAAGQRHADDGTVDGAVTYTPDADYNGADTFTYYVSDGNGGTDTATVDGDGDAGQRRAGGGDDSYSTRRHGARDPAGVLGNDTDVDGDALSAQPS